MQAWVLSMALNLSVSVCRFSVKKGGYIDLIFGTVNSFYQSYTVL